ncbi:MAG: hypothetical protein PHR39_01650 [Actinomycetota bacterium]|nr:hypothetical protein [Actinomycetota bacterium]
MYKRATKNILHLILMIIVFILVIIAIYANIDKFLSKETIKYIQINIENGINFNDIITQYTTYENKEDFISEVKRINKLDNIEDINKSSLMIPIKDK